MSNALIITVDAADTILEEQVLSGDRVGWDGLTDTDKAVLIRRGQTLINAGSWNGRKCDDDQEFAFPRIDDDEVIVKLTTIDEASIPVEINEAIALLAWSFADRIDEWERRRVIASGVASHGVSGLSEAFVARPGNLGKADLESVPEAWVRLQPFWRIGGRIV